MDQSNSSSQRQDNIEPTQNVLSLNLLSLQASSNQQFQNQEELPNMSNQLEDTSITITSENSIKKKLKCLIFRRYISQNRIFENSECQVINQNQDQHAIISYQDQDNNNSIRHISSKNDNNQSIQPQQQNISQQDKYSQLNIYSKKEDEFKQIYIAFDQVSYNQIGYLQSKQDQTDTSLQKDQQSYDSKQTFKHEQITDQRNPHQQKNFEKDIFMKNKDSSQSCFSQNEIQTKHNQITENLISQQVNCKQIREFQREISNSNKAI
ncbi:hypothetical protein ABPG73_004731 [Tetrahymena malaccensis]